MNFIVDKKPRWLTRALNPRSPMTENNETVKLISYDNRVAPTIIRIGTRGKGKFVKLTNEEAIKRANKNNTFLEFGSLKAVLAFDTFVRNKGLITADIPLNIFLGSELLPADIKAKSISDTENLPPDSLDFATAYTNCVNIDLIVCALSPADPVAVSTNSAREPSMPLSLAIS